MINEEPFSQSLCNSISEMERIFPFYERIKVDFNKQKCQKKKIKKEPEMLLKQQQQQQQQQLQQVQLIRKQFKYQEVSLFFNLSSMGEKLLFIPGDFYVNLDYKQETSPQEQINYYQSLKKVSRALIDNKKKMVVLEIYTSEDVKFADYSQVKSALEKYPDPFVCQFLPLIEAHYHMIQRDGNDYQLLRQGIGKMQHEQILLRRRQYFDKYVNQYIEANFKETDFFYYYKYQYQSSSHRLFTKIHPPSQYQNMENLSNDILSPYLLQQLQNGCQDCTPDHPCKISHSWQYVFMKPETTNKEFEQTDSDLKSDVCWMEYTQVGVSFPIIALLGTDPSSFINMSMRNGFLDFSSSQSKQENNLKSLACRLLKEDQDFYCNTVEDLTLLTLDEYEIKTTQSVKSINMKYPPELRLGINGRGIRCDIPIFVKLNIDLNTIKYLIAKRQNNPQFQKQWENEQFGYTLQSQLFLEKYYSNTLDTLNDKEDHNLRYYYNKQCSYKPLKQNKQLCIEENQSNQE